MHIATTEAQVPGFFDDCPIEAQHSLRVSHAAAVEAMLGALGGRWSVERHTDYAGDLLLLVIPEGGDAAGPTFVLHRDGTGIRLGVNRGDAYASLDTVPTVQAAMQRIREHLSGMRSARQAA